MENLENFQADSSNLLGLSIKPGILDNSDLLMPYSKGLAQPGSFKDPWLDNDLLLIEPAPFASEQSLADQGMT